MIKRDNNCGEKLTDVEKLNISDLSSMANKNLIELQTENPDLLIFPQRLGQFTDGVEKSDIFNLENDILTTYNLMGFIGRNSTQLTITSRFTKNDSNDYFLHYMLQKVFSINILKFDQTPNSENIWDFLLYLFPYYLQKAYTQGIYKSYKKEQYNDSNVKGTINIKSHISKNIPFTGNISYSTREQSFDNNVTQLVRHTIEYIKIHHLGKAILSNDSEIRDIVAKFIFATDKTYNKNARQKIIVSNLKPVPHPYFTEYISLQKICLNILKYKKITFGKEKDKIYGLLFDGAWLWEEYLNTVLKDSFIHPQNRTGRNRHYLFEDFQSIYPDFISITSPRKVGDAKYIPLGQQKTYSENSDRATSIYYKTIAYMYRFSSEIGFLLFPNPGISIFETYKIKDTEGILKKIGLAIPQTSENFTEFIKTMNLNELKLKLNLMKEKIQF